ncbi:hypothetical protein LFT44_16675 [Arthrobacter sp. FW306-05-C]|uniref:hypothetical protein n=1 Tax=unclassified Arthrobacter TaxID=235627 RepID=UPI001F2590BC|nr:hypothetical protein [Arthrobacter sp. FW306-05-C]UKA66112.1 hypothetical protein LFT44_16675 [Arthrobacter sp. FW306-05-C]
MEEARKTALILLRNRTLTPDDLWIAFYAIGGTAGPLELEAYIHGLLPVSMIDAELLSDALHNLQDI